MRLRVVRKKKRITQEELSELSGVNQATISQLENGERKRPSWDVVARLARALDVEPEELFPTQKGTAA